MKIKSVWTYETGRWDEDLGIYTDRELSDPKEKILDVVLSKGFEGKNTISFVGGPTGYESYYLEDINNTVLKSKDDDTCCICAGTINSWANCTVKISDLKPILEVFKDAVI